MSSQVAIAVVSYETRDLLRACLESMRADHESGLAVVSVVDNASGDGSAAMVRREFGWVELVESAENLGFGRAVNLVSERSDAPWIAPANADIRLERGALAALLEAGEADPRAGALAPRLILPDGSTQHSAHSFPRARLAIAKNLGLTRLIPGLGDRLCIEGRWNPERRREVEWAHGAFQLVRRDAFDSAGRFDERQWMYAEDLDLAWRLRRTGFTTVYVPEARVHHELSAAAIQSFGEERERRHMVAAYVWMGRRQGLAAARFYAVANATGAGLRAAALAPLAKLSGERFGAALERERRYSRLHVQAFREGRRLLGAG